MIAEGLYSLDYGAARDGETVVDGALALVRDGRILGSDRWGGVFEGKYGFDTAQRRGSFTLRLRVPPQGILVTGLPAGERGETIDIAGEISEAGDGGSFEVAVAGEKVRVRLRYLGPVPA